MTGYLTSAQKRKIDKEIHEFKATGKLPTDHDTRCLQLDLWDENPGASYVERGPDKTLDPYGQAVEIDDYPAREPLISQEAETLAARSSEFQASLSPKEELVFSMHMLGGITRKEVATILGISVQRVGELVKLIRAKATKFTKEENTGIDP